MRLFRPLGLEDIENDKRYIEAQKFINDFNPKKGKDYSWVYDYSRELLCSAREGSRALDSKAESMVRYLGPGSGILGMSLAWFTTTKVEIESWLLICYIIGILFIVMSIFAALYAYLPHSNTLGVKIKDAFKVVDYYDNKERALGYFATGFIVSSVILDIVIDKKATYLTICHYFFTIGLSVFILATVILLVISYVSWL